MEQTTSKSEPERRPIVTMMGYCTMLLARMAESAANDKTQFPEFMLGLTRLTAGWGVEMGIHPDHIHDAVDLGIEDFHDLQREDENAVEIPIEGH